MGRGTHDVRDTPAGDTDTGRGGDTGLCDCDVVTGSCAGDVELCDSNLADARSSESGQSGLDT